MKKVILCILLLMLTASSALAEYDPIQGAKNNLTEVFNYTVEEADSFVFEDNGIDTVRFWPPEHPDWVYTLFYDSYGATGGDTPFYGEHFDGYPGEGNINEILRRAREGNWWADWNEEARAAYQQLNTELGLGYDTAMLDAIENPHSTGADALQAFLIRCYGPEYMWTPALISLRDELLRQNGLTLPEDRQPEAGVRSWGYQDLPGPGITRMEFYRDVPEQLNEVFSHPRLAGWQCLCGALWQSDGQFTNHPVTPYGLGLAAFEKDGKRLLVTLDEKDGVWTLLPIGENALYTDCDMVIHYLYDGHFSIEYALSDTETARFKVLLSNENGRRSFCQLQQYERVKKGGEALRIQRTVLGDAWTVSQYQEGERSATFTKVLEYVPYLGAMDISDFPTTYEDFKADRPTLIPEGYGVTAGVHLRAKTSSRSKDLGTFNPGALIPILETLPGDPDPWYRTKLGSLSGYVSSSYVRTSTADLPYPLTAAKTKKAVSLKKGTGLLDGTVMELPAGTKMHLVLEDGGWVYVCIPQGELNWFMDVNGIFGWLKKDDLITAGMACQLDWIN